MKSYLPLVLILILSSLTSCEKCRYADVAVGDLSLELVFLDSTGASVFDSQFDIDELVILDSVSDTVELALNPSNNGVSFRFDKARGIGQESNDDYTVQFDSLDTKMFSINYKSSAVGECGGWKYDFVRLTLDDVVYSREEDFVPIEIEL